MTGTEPKIDRELLGRVAALTPGQQRWLRTVLQSILTMEAPARRRAGAEREERTRPRGAEGAEERPRRGLDEVLSGEEVSREDYPELADELEGIAGIADLLRESGRERRRVGEELMRLFEGSDGSSEDDDEEEGARFN